MIESARKTFMPIQTLDLHRVGLDIRPYYVKTLIMFINLYAFCLWDPATNSKTANPDYFLYQIGCLLQSDFTAKVILRFRVVRPNQLDQPDET